MEQDKNSGLTYRRWEATGAKASLLLVHGLGAHSGRWESLADFFLRNGISSYALELRGFGETKDLKGHIDSFDIYINDITRLCGIIKEEDGKKVFLLGESIGGLISFLAAISKPDLFDGLICISPAFANRLRFTVLDYISIFFLRFLNPTMQFNVPFTSKMCTRDIEYQRAMNGNGREHRLATSKFLFEAARAQLASRLLKGRVRKPALFLLSGRDTMVDERVSKKVFRGLKVKDKALIEYPGMRHALSIELGKEKVFGDILGWLEKRI